MGRGSHEKASAEGLLYGHRRRGPGPRLVKGLDDLIEQLRHRTIPEPLLAEQDGLLIKRPAEATSFAAAEAIAVDLAGFARPYQESELRLTLAGGSEKAIALDWLGLGPGSSAEIDLLRGISRYLPQSPATVFFFPTSDRNVSAYLNAYFPDGGDHPLGLVVDPADRRPSESSELDYLAAEVVEVEYLGDLVAADDLTDFMRYSRQPLITLQKAFAARSFAFTLPLERFNEL